MHMRVDRNPIDPRAQTRIVTETVKRIQQIGGRIDCHAYFPIHRLNPAHVTCFGSLVTLIARYFP